ncbi:protein RIC-3 [Oryzias latipes]|uniref:Resistance to inhibitors of cholinesterase protein 3 N-terminal domain-containing protein n=1 Tax=Oryzias latipes TaxID=8090 RepID=H2L6I9_ORYLA|nr:protein RIC-3 [Oryzias latipes]
MTMSTFQKVTLATCVVLCVALLLPKILLSRGRKDAAERPEGSGYFPPRVHPQMAPEGRGQRAAGSSFSRAHSPETSAKTKGGGAGPGAGGKSNLAGQIIPVYGFGILLYILYILFKITSKGSSKPPESKFHPIRSENMKRKITDFELAQLQEKLRVTELVMENIVSSAHHSPDRVTGVTPDQEQSLLQTLTEITRVMQEGQLVDGLAPEKIHSDWNDHPGDHHQYWEHPHCCCQHRSNAGAEREAEGDPAPRGGGGGDTEVSSEMVSTAAASAGAVQESDLTLREEENNHMEECGDAGILEEELDGVLKELELSLRVTSTKEQEKTQEPGNLTDKSCSSVRRRNKRRRTKKPAQ